jgi:hypothetical protein
VEVDADRVHHKDVPCVETARHGILRTVYHVLNDT